MFILFTAITVLLIAGSSAIAAVPSDAGTPADGIPDVVIDPITGEAIIDPNGVPLTGFVIKSAGGALFNPIPLQFVPPDNPIFEGLPLASFNVTTNLKASAQAFIAALTPGGTGTISIDINLGQLIADGQFPNLVDLDVTYTRGDQAGIFDMDVIGAVPEPSSIVLLLLGLAGVGMFRRRRAA